MAKPKKPAARKATVKFTSRKAGAAAPAATPAVAAPIPVAEKKRPDAPPAPVARRPDAPMMRRLAALGVAPGRPLRWNALDRWSASLGRWIADRAVARRLKHPPNLVRGWLTPPSVLGRYGTNYEVRGAVAMVGLGANLPVDAMYPNARVDSRGDALDGSHRYRVRFAAGALPPGVPPQSTRSTAGIDHAPRSASGLGQ